ncbi:MAG: hypothetical protein L0Y72_31200 [Gemmataceae bacterium]|nr:hypothetical protein [Gemmataceae bacterium]MCI0743518.1 hypothetical protein [Gemmataceae bacterium]
MIHRIGVVCQDRNSRGFLEGIKRRLKCDAQLIEPTTGALGKSTTMTKRQAKLATTDLLRKSVDLIVRFTDADKNRWQDVQRQELGAFPHECNSIIVCGVAVENTEQWLALDPPYIEQALAIANAARLSPDQLTNAIKNAIARHRLADEPVWK